MLLPALGNARQKAKDVSCINNLKQQHILWALYSDGNDGFCWARSRLGNSSVGWFFCDSMFNREKYQSDPKSKLFFCPTVVPGRTYRHPTNPVYDVSSSRGYSNYSINHSLDCTCQANFAPYYKRNRWTSWRSADGAFSYFKPATSRYPSSHLFNRCGLYDTAAYFYLHSRRELMCFMDGSVVPHGLGDFTYNCNDVLHWGYYPACGLPSKQSLFY